MSDFSFPSLPKPKPLAKEERRAATQQLPDKNPLLARATITDRSATDSGVGGAAAKAPAAGAPSTSGDAQQGGVMGGSMGKPAPVSRYGRMAAPGRQKVVPFEKGWSQMDWVRLTQTHPDLAGLGPGGRPRRGIPMEEVALHCTQEDCWTVLRGKVYNITPYMRFHPGGVPLLVKVGGKDGTALFNKFHAWVNYEFLLAKCLVGLLAPPSAAGGGTAGAAEGAPAPAGAAPAPVPVPAAEPPAPVPALAAEEAAERSSGGGGGGSSDSSSSTELQQQPREEEEGGGGAGGEGVPTALDEKLVSNTS